MKTTQNYLKNWHAKTSRAKYKISGQAKELPPHAQAHDQNEKIKRRKNEHRRMQQVMIYLVFAKREMKLTDFTERLP